MRNTIKVCALLMCVMVLPACTTTRPFNLIDPEARDLMQEVDSVLISKQDGVKADINVSRISSYVQGHFLPVLIDIGLNSLRTHKANKIMVPIHETLDEYDFTQDIHEEFNVALDNSRIEGMGELELIREAPNGFKIAYLRQSKSDAVMFIDVDYAFTPKFDALNLSSHILIMPVNEALSPYKEKPDTDDVIEIGDNIYRNAFNAAVVPKGMTDSKSENGDVWAQMSHEELSGRMQKAAKKLTEAIAYDLSLDDVDEDALERESETENPQPAAIEKSSIEQTAIEQEDKAPSDIQAVEG